MDEASTDIIVRNERSMSIEVSINRWGEGCSDYYTVAPGTPATWDRYDTRGFVMAISINNMPQSYFVRSRDVINVRNDGVFRNGIIIQPLS